MDPFIELLKIILPSFVVFLACFYLVRSFLDNESRKRSMELKLAGRELVTPIRLQAYERIVLLLERISPNSLVMRIYKPNMTARQMHTGLISGIRSEFEHNLSQQIYMSTNAWESVKSAKEEIVKLVNLTSIRIPENAPASELSQLLIENCSRLKVLPTSAAIEVIKREIAQNF